MNNSSFSNITTQEPANRPSYMALFNRLYYSYYAMTSLYILVGTPLCVWFLAAILTAPDMRRRLRNQLVCSICLLYMLKSTVSGGIEMSVIVSFREGKAPPNCYVYAFFMNLRTIFEFAGAWQVVLLLLVYLAQLLGYDPTSTLTPMAVNMGKGALLVLPFVLGVILVPSIGSLFQHDYAKRSPGCIITTTDGSLVLRGVDYMVPLIISIILLIVVAVLYYRRFCRGFFTSRAIKNEMVRQGQQVDNVIAYLVVISIDIVCRLPATLIFVEMNMKGIQRFTYSFISWMIIDSRSIILPWAWLLLEDIRERIKIWRPWYRPAPGIDLTISYSKEEKAVN